MLKLASTLALSLALLSPLTSAGSLQKSQIPAKARWVAHVDVERLARSEIFGAMITEGGEFNVDFGDAQGLCGFDPLKDLKSISLFSTAEAEEHTVAVVITTDKIDAALRCFQQESGYHTVQAGARTLHAWSDREGFIGDDDGSKSAQYAFVAAIEGTQDRIVVVSEDKDALVEELDVLDGRGQSAASGVATTIPAWPEAGAIVFAAAGEPLAALAEVEAASAVARLAQACLFEFGESRGAIFANLWIGTASPDDALKVQQILQGLVALASFMEPSPEVAPMIRSLLAAVTITADGNELSARFRYDVAQLLDLKRALERVDHAGPHERDSKSK